MKTLHHKFIATSLCAALLASGSAIANQSVDDELKELKDRIKKLEKAQKEQPKVKLTGGGLKVSHKKSNTTFKLNGRLHLDVNSYDGAYNANNDGSSASDIFSRRARLGISGAHKDIGYKFTVDFNGPDSQGESARIQNAILSFNGFKKNGGPQVQIGKIKEDVTLDGVNSSNHIAAISRPMIVNAVSPFFNWGARINQSFKGTGLRYAFGIYQAEDGSSNGRDSDGDSLLAYTGRVNWAPLSEQGKVVHLGAWASYRDFNGNSLRNRARGEVRRTSVRLLDSNAGGSSVAVDSTTQYGLELAGIFGPLSLQAEYIMRDADATNSGVSEPELDGHYIAASYFLTGQSRHYDRKKGTLKQPKGVANAWELVARYSSADATFANQGTEVDVYTLGVNYYLNTRLRFMLNYVHADVDGAGTTALVGSEDEGDAITFRTQYAF